MSKMWLHNMHPFNPFHVSDFSYLKEEFQQNRNKVDADSELYGHK